MITEQEGMEQLQQLLQMGGWLNVMKPTITQRANEAIKALCQHPKERSGQFKDIEDSDLRAIVREAKWNLEFWDQQVNVYQHNRRRDELDRQTNGTAPANP